MFWTCWLLILYDFWALAITIWDPYFEPEVFFWSFESCCFPLFTFLFCLAWIFIYKQCSHLCLHDTFRFFIARATICLKKKYRNYPNPNPKRRVSTSVQSYFSKKAFTDASSCASALAFPRCPHWKWHHANQPAGWSTYNILTILCRTHRPQTITPGGHIPYKIPALCICVRSVCVCVHDRVEGWRDCCGSQQQSWTHRVPFKACYYFPSANKTPHSWHLLFANTSPPNLSLMALSKLPVTRSTSLIISRNFIVKCFYTFVMMQHCMSCWEENTLYYLCCFPVT